jgi:hypothetical protein
MWKAYQVVWMRLSARVALHSLQASVNYFVLQEHSFAKYVLVIQVFDTSSINCAPSLPFSFSMKAGYFPSVSAVLYNFDCSYFRR